MTKTIATNPPSLEELENPLALGSAYLDYCVKQGWLEKTGEGAAQYSLTEKGKKKLSNVSFNLDLSVIASRRDNTKKRRKRHKK
jgi:DNA-binding PadR family transcriptional regulator